MILRDLRTSSVRFWLALILLAFLATAASAQDASDPLDADSDEIDFMDEMEAAERAEAEDAAYLDESEDEYESDEADAEVETTEEPDLDTESEDVEESAADKQEDAELEAKAAAIQEAADEPSADIEIITVTANRRTESLQEAAVSVTALGGTFIEDVGLTNFADIQNFTPNLQIIPQGDSRSTSIRIRGIGSIGSNAGIDPSVGVFIDGVYQGRAGMSVGDLIDIQAVEVLRGPQGTLYGKNTAAGAIKVTSRRPNYEPSLMLEFDGGTYKTLEGRFTGNIPIIDGVLATRLTGYGATRDGYETNTAPIHSGSNLNGSTRWGLRSSTVWDVNEVLSFLLRGDYAEVREDCCSPDLWRYGEDSDAFLTSATTLAANMGLTLQPASCECPLGSTLCPPSEQVDCTQQERRGDRRIAVDQVPRNDVQVGGVSLEGVYERWDHNFTSLTAWRTYTSGSLFDADFSEMDAILSTTDVDLNQVSTELRVESPEYQYADYVAGFYFFYSDMQTDDILGFTEDYIRFSLFGGDDSSENTGRNNHQTTSVAGYGDVNLHVSEYWDDDPNITLTGGVRVGWEQKKHKGSQISTGYLKDTFCPDPEPSNPNPPCLETPLSGPDAYSNQQNGDTYVTGRFIFKYEPEIPWDPIESSMLYTSYATGYKSGGYNQLRTSGQSGDQAKLFFEPEESQSVEVGLRSSWLDRLITFNMTGFYTDYNNFQAQVFDGLGIRVINAGSFETYGFEADLTVVPLPGFMTVLGAGYTITNYTDFPQGPCIQQDVAVNPMCEQDLTGKRLDNTPVFDLNLFSQYENQFLQYEDVNWFVMMNYNYQSTRYLNASLDPFLKVRPTSMLGFRTGFRSPNESWEVSFWARNVTNEQIWAIGFDVPTLGGYAAFQGPPRTYGGTIRLRF